MKLRLPRRREQAFSSAGGAIEIVPGFDGAQILSHSGMLEAGQEERKLLCLLADGRLLVVAGQELNPHVQSYIGRLERLGQPYQLVPGDIAVIYRMNRISTRIGGPQPEERHQEHTMMQVTA